MELNGARGKAVFTTVCLQRRRTARLQRLVKSKNFQRSAESQDVYRYYGGKKENKHKKQHQLNEKATTKNSK